MNPQELLNAHRIKLSKYGPGQYYTTCPQCSATRSKQHKALKVLGVLIQPDGKVVWNCNHCRWSGPPKGSGKSRSKTELPSHTYRDRDGIVRFRKVRNRPGKEPQFWLEQPDGKDGWKKGTKGVDTSIIYRADEAAKAIEAGGAICVVEGEKDADNLWCLDIPATCNAHGASEPGKKPKWTGKHSAQLEAADIIIFNDNDAAGYEHADTTCKLSQGVTKRVRRLDLKEHWPEIPKGGDISDWLAVGGEHTPDKLRALIAAAPDYKTEAAPPPIDDDAVELARLAKLDPLSYGRARKDAAKQLGGISVSLLDAAVRAKRAELGLNDGDDGKQGRPIEFQEVEPWDQPVDGAQLLGALVDILSKYVVMTEHQKVAISLWILHAYLIDRSMISPRLAIRSPVKGCGKTTLLDVVARLLPRPLATANVSPSAIFRVISGHRPTLLIDEADTLFKDGDETLRGILNAGHRQGGTVLRSVGDEHEPRAFACYAATVIALIGQLPGTLADRSVDIVLARRRPNETITAFRLDRTESLDALARQIARWARDNGERIGVTDPQMPAGIYNRAADNWRPLLAIAEAAGGDKWPEKARNAAVALVGGEVDEVSRTELLLSDIRTIFTVLKLDEITSADLIERLCALTPRPWSEMGRPPKPMTQNKLARLLKPLAIPPELITDRRIAGYRLARFDEAFARYLGPEGVSNLSPSPNPTTTGVSDRFATSRPENPREVSKSQKPNNDGLRRGGEVAKGGNGQTRANRFSAEALEDTAEWYLGVLRRRRGEPDLEAIVDQALRERLFNKYDLSPAELEAAVEQVKQRGLSQQAIEALADRVLHYAADHAGDADLTASTERSLRCWVAEAGVLPEHVAIEAERVMTRVWRTY